MSAKNQLKKIIKQEKKAKNKLLDLVSNNAKKKKILKKVNEIQSIDKKKSKIEKKQKRLEKKSKKVVFKDRKPKKNKGNKTKKQPKNVSKTPVIQGSNIKKDEVKAETKVNGREVLTESTSFNSKEAISMISSMATVDEVKHFTANDPRVSVINRAKSKINALTGS